MDLRGLQFTTEFKSSQSAVSSPVSSGNDFQWHTIPFLWVPVLSPCLSHNNSRFTKSQQCFCSRLKSPYIIHQFTKSLHQLKWTPAQQSFPVTTSRHGPTVLLLLEPLLLHRLPLYCCLFSGRCLARGVYDKIFSFVSSPSLLWGSSQLQEKLNKSTFQLLWTNTVIERQRVGPIQLNLRYETTKVPSVFQEHKIPILSIEFQAVKRDDWIDDSIKPGRSIVIHLLALWGAVVNLSRIKKKLSP
jgi:hypothetical protein